MRTIPIVGWIANATARLGGTRGAVTRRARDAGCSRQTVYNHARKVKAAVEAECGGGNTREALIEQLESLLEENAQLWEWLDQTIEFPPARQQELAVKATAMGLSSSASATAAAIWWASFPAAMSARIPPKTLPATSTVRTMCR